MRVAGIPLGVGQNTLNPSSLTVALLHFDGTNGSTTFVDSSIYNRTITTIGSPVISTASSVSGGSSLLLQGWPEAGVDGLRAIIPENGLGVVTTKTWTIEGYVKIDAATHTNAGIVGIYSGLSREYVGLYYGKLRVGDAGLTGYASNVDFSGALLSTSVFNKIKITGDGTNIKLYIDDSLILTVAYPAWANASLENSLAFGKSFATHVQGGYYDEWKAVKELHTFDPSLTLALLHFDGANNTQVFTDSSPTSQNIVASNSNTGVYLSNGWSKFGATSCFFDGASFVNYLRTNSAYVGGNLGAGDWQIDCWIKPASLSGMKGIFNIYNGSSTTPINLIINAGVLKVQVDTIANSAVWEFEVAHQTALFANSEYHVRALRKDGYIRLFLDGIEATTPANIGTTPLASNGEGTIQIGAAWNYVGGFSQQFSGYIDEFRISKEAVYTGNFTPPTAPFSY